MIIQIQTRLTHIYVIIAKQQSLLEGRRFMVLLIALLLIVTPFLCVQVERVDGKLKVTSVHFGINRDKTEKEKDSNQKD